MAPSQRPRQQPPGTVRARERRFHRRAPNVATGLILDEEDEVDRPGPRSLHPSSDPRVEVSEGTIAVEVEEEDTGNAGDRLSGLSPRVGRYPRRCRDSRSSVPDVRVKAPGVFACVQQFLGVREHLEHLAGGHVGHEGGRRVCDGLLLPPRGADPLDLGDEDAGGVFNPKVGAVTTTLRLPGHIADRSHYGRDDDLAKSRRVQVRVAQPPQHRDRDIGRDLARNYGQE